MSSGDELAQDRAADTTLPSYDIFMSFLRKRKSDSPKSLAYDASRILSKECYDVWLQSRRQAMANPEKSFQTALLGHISGTSRRRPFPPDIEEAILHELRKKQIWECFRGTNMNIGVQGIRKYGYHEALKRGETSPKKERKKRRKSSLSESTKPVIKETSRKRIAANTSFHLCDVESSEPFGIQGTANSDEKETMDKRHVNVSIYDHGSQSTLTELLAMAEMIPNTPSRMLAASVVQFFSNQQNLATFIETTQELHSPFFSSPLYHLLDLNPGDDFRLHDRFLLPENTTTTNSPIGTFFLSDSFLIVGSHGLEMLNEKVDAMRNWVQVCAFRIQMARILTLALPILKSKGHIVIQRMVVTGGSSMSVLREMIQRVPNGYSVTVHDVSYKFAHLLSLPKLFL